MHVRPVCLCVIPVPSFRQMAVGAQNFILPAGPSSVIWLAPPRLLSHVCQILLGLCILDCISVNELLVLMMKQMCDG